MNAFDCARSYGHAEEVLGRWMESRGCRDRVTVLTKCGDIRDGVVQINRQVILDQLARSLEALRTEQIDIYLLHRDDPNTPVEEYIDTLNELKAAGKFRIFGVSNWTRARIEKANRYAESRGLAGFSVSSPNFGLTRQMRDLWGGGCVTLSGPEHAEDRAWYADNQMPVIAYSALGRGFSADASAPAITKKPVLFWIHTLRRVICTKKTWSVSAGQSSWPISSEFPSPRWRCAIFSPVR